MPLFRGGVARCFFFPNFHLLGVGGGFSELSGPWSQNLHALKRPAMSGYQFLFPQAMRKNMAQSWGQLEKRQTACSKEEGGSFVGTVLSLNSRNLTLSYSIKFRFICMLRHRVERFHLQMIAKRPCDGTDLSKQAPPSCLFFFLWWWFAQEN